MFPLLSARPAKDLFLHKSLGHLFRFMALNLTISRYSDKIIIEYSISHTEYT